MVQHTITILYDDLDTSTDSVDTHHVALDAVTYEIDLSEANLNRLHEALRPFTAAGRRLPASRAARAVATGARTRTGDRSATATVRRWWLDNRHRKDLPDFRSRGAIPHQVAKAYRETH